MNHKQARPHRADFARRRFRRQDPKPGAQALVGGVMTGPSPVAAEHVADLKFRRAVERLHRLGPRVVGEFLAEIGAERSIMTVIDRKLDAYTEVEPETLKAASGDDFWQPPLHGVGDG